MQNPNKQPTKKARLRFQKTGLMRFVGHLDLMRFFQKAIRRAHLPIAYSSGFHPHQILSFALPLGIGVTSEGEYLDMELVEEIEPIEAMKRLNAEMAEGMKILSFSYLPDQEKKAMSLVEAARYYVYMKEGKKPLPTQDVLREGIHQFYDESSSIKIIKKTKKGERELDLKPLIFSFELAENKEDVPSFIPLCKEAPSFLVTLSAGSVDNIKPELLFLHFMRSLGYGEEDYRLGIHRLELYKHDEKGRLIGLGAF